jgi:hypothetical protein
MKRLILISCSFLVVFSGAIAAWESCNRVSFASDAHHGSPDQYTDIIMSRDQNTTIQIMV